MTRALGLTLLLLLLVAGATAPPAAAKELPPEVRRMAERAFLEGRLPDLDVILAGADEPLDRFPLLLRDVWWRGTVPPKPVPGAADDLLARRLAWLAMPRGPYPRAGSGGADPYPILTALVRDRVRRETHGHAGLPQEGPLEALSLALDPDREKREIYFAGDRIRYLMSITYRTPPPYPEKVQADREAEDLRVRNGQWALIALGGFLLLSLLARWLLGRTAREAS